MPIHSLHHININTDKLEETRRFYEDVLGLVLGPRPNFAGDGFWLYAKGGTIPIVHLSLGAGGDNPRTRVGADGNGFDHFALFATDVDGVSRHLEKMNIKYEKRIALDGIMTQLFMSDPNGVTVEIGFMHKDEEAFEAGRAAEQSRADARDKPGKSIAETKAKSKAKAREKMPA